MSAAGFTHDDKNNKSVEWYTPKWIFDELRTQFDLDPCAPIGGVPWIPAKHSYHEAIDGLQLMWFGNVWCNPPYGRHTGAWLEKMHTHRNGIALVFARTDNLWFHSYAVFADAILFLQGRIAFVDAHQKTAGSVAGAGSMLIAWGKHNVDALRGMSNRGHLWELRELDE